MSGLWEVVCWCPNRLKESNQPPLCKMSCEILVKIKNDSRARQRKRTLCRVREFKVERVFKEFRSPYSRAQSYTFSLEWPVLYYKNKLLVSLYDLEFHLANRCRTALVSILHFRVQTNNTDMAESTKSALLKLFILCTWIKNLYCFSSLFLIWNWN